MPDTNLHAIEAVHVATKPILSLAMVYQVYGIHIITRMFPYPFYLLSVTKVNGDPVER